jgi:hypothetical protein
MNTRTNVLSGLGCGLALVAACSTTATPPPRTASSPEAMTTTVSTDQGGERAKQITLTATVVKIDQAERLVTLRGSDGVTRTVRVGEEARNLAQVKEGDTVVVTYYQSVAFQVVPEGQGKLGVSENSAGERAAPGGKPGASAARVITIVADIVQLDRENQQATLRGADGEMMTVDVADPKNFDKVKVGDRVEIALSEAFAIDVHPAQPNE